MTHPEQTALVEAAGALVSWDLLGAPDPVTEVHAPDRAAAWRWELAEPAVLAAVHRLACLNWARSWWPASSVAGVPPLHPALLAAEHALATHAVSHLLDDEHATDRALSGLLPLPLEALSANETLHAEALALAGRLAGLAEDFGVQAPAPAALARRDDYALAASGGGTPDGLVVQRGSAPVDWSLVPAGAVDAVAEASWIILRRNGISVLEASIPPSPGGFPPRLAARFGPVKLDLEPTPSGELTGSIPLPANVLLLPADQRVLTVYAPEFAEPTPPDPAAPARRAALVRFALGRLDDPAATLTERAGRLL
ncbi:MULTISPECIES: hypothetical protein [unclassified Crossiella]|uniref:hypothetical protein n=1 Tax=unclassified Crossiella TaxID=2620835 RepID=UPI001FFFCCBA|nr:MULTISPECIES: hypothetical protein [unclassified Crossiella]MCK2244718.1 hypothetical protein [Crossiella sp. S99.2]MCK2258284.1 hypothetical protein [Crossiella sp. S99.1]